MSHCSVPISIVLIASGLAVPHAAVPDNRDPHLKNVKPLRDVGSVENQASGAYLFRPATANEVPTRIVENTVSLISVHGKTISEMHQQFNTWTSQIVRLREGSAAIELGKQ